MSFHDFLTLLHIQISITRFVNFVSYSNWGGATVPIFKTQLRSVFPGPPIYFTDFIFFMVFSYFHLRMGI